jgi:hypothetical protein
MEHPVALDFFSGRGGWTDGLLAAGFTVYGFDIKEYEGYKGIFVKRDILEMTPEEIRSYNPRFICCSSPCEEFSVHGMKMFHKKPKHPDMGIKIFNHSKMLCESSGVPYIMENVRAAQVFVGRSVNHCGPFHLWGNGVPAIIPPDCYRASKGLSFKRRDGSYGGESVKVCELMYADKKLRASTTATIPPALSSYVGRIAMENYGRL